MNDIAPRDRPLLLGHRGARALKSIPENTFSSFDRALEDGCDGFEFDVRLTADGAAVICHDPRFQGIEIAGTRSRQLSELPRLDEALARYQGRAFLDIELKVAGLERHVVSSLRDSPPRRGFVVSSFLPEALRELRALDSAIPLGLICEKRAQLRCWMDLPAEYLIPHRKLVNSALVRQLKSMGKRVLVWTVNDSAQMIRLRDSGVDGIISDDTHLLCQTLSGNSNPKVS